MSVDKLARFCIDERDCRFRGESRTCLILEKSYKGEKKQCPFRKPKDGRE